MTLVGSFFHVGVVVPSLEAARGHLSEVLGIAWGPIVDIDIDKERDADGHNLTLPLRMCYSTVAPRMELIEELPGSVWECNEHSNLHHIGFWSRLVGCRRGGSRGGPLPPSSSVGVTATPPLCSPLITETH